MKKTIAITMLALAGMVNAAPMLTEKIAKKHQITRTDVFYGFDRTVFDFDGYEAWVVEPKAGTEREGRPWTWTMQWATAYVPRTGVPKLLADGFHHVTIITFKDKMNEQGLKVSAAFQKYLVEELGFAAKANLIGMSWGGFFSTRYTVTYPQNVEKVYLDAPLLCFEDFDPTKPTNDVLRRGPWNKVAPADGKWTTDPRMPVNMAEKFAATGIPVFLVYGGQDMSCPPQNNAEPFIKRFKAAGGEKTLKVLYRPYFGHHPHGLELNDKTIVNFFEKPFVPENGSQDILGRVEGKQAFYGPTIRDRLWMWGHHPVKGETTFKGDFAKRWCGQAIDQADGCKLMGIPNDCVVRWGNMPEYPWGDYFEQFHKLKRFSFSITDSAKGTVQEKMRIAFEELKPKFPNFTGCFLDDYFCKSDIGQGQLGIDQIAKEVHARGLRLSIVLYSDQNGLKMEYADKLKYCDEISFWFWRSENIPTMLEQTKKCRKFIGPNKDLLLGLYMWDYTKSEPVEADLMKMQLDCAYQLMRDGTVSGLIFHPSYLASIDVPSVRLAKEWIAKHGDELWNVK